MDDDNAYHPSLWNELRTVGKGRIAVLAVRRHVHPPPRCDGFFAKLTNYTLTAGGLAWSRSYAGSASAGQVRWERREMRIDRPRVEPPCSGRVVGFEAGWCDQPTWMTRVFGPRAYCVDMAGFAFDAALLQGRPDLAEPFSFNGRCEQAAHLAKRRGHGKRSSKQPYCTTQGGEDEFLRRLTKTDRAADAHLQPLGNAGRDVLVFHNEYRSAPRALVEPRATCNL